MNGIITEMTEDIKSCEKGGTAPDFTYQIKKKKKHFEIFHASEQLQDK